MNSADGRGLRIGVVGTCQVSGIAAVARLLVPAAEVRCWQIGVQRNETVEDIAAQLSEFDFVITQFAESKRHGPFSVGQLRERRIEAAYLPNLTFQGFHPDLTYILAKDGSLIRGPHSDYHSLIVVASFTLGLPEHRVLPLFNAYIYSEMGYFEVFESAKEALLESFEQAGYDLNPYFSMWMDKVGQFMYTINHPHIVALTTLSFQVLLGAGLIPPGQQMPENVADYLATGFIWPQYPPLAKRIGLLGSDTFTRSSRTVPAGSSRQLSLHEFIADSYRHYSAHPVDTLRSTAVRKVADRLQSLLS